MTGKELKEIRKKVLFLLKNHDIKHGPDHLKRVVQNALEAAKILNLEEKLDLNLLEATCLLHDLTYVQPEFKYKITDYVLERSISTRVLYPFLKSLSINKADAEIILRSCSKHPHSFPFKKLNKTDNDYTKILQDSDTIDFFHPERVKITRKKFKDSFWKKPTLPLFDAYVNYVKKNLKKYLNYPELHEKLALTTFNEPKSE